MAENCFHASIEGAQHGAKSLTAFLDYAKTSGSSGAQPSNYMLQDGAKFKKPAEIKEAFTSRGMTLDGISAHCPFWVHTTAWTGSPTVRPFLQAELAAKFPAEIEKWSEPYLLRFRDLAAALEVTIIPIFWGVAIGWELATGYPWGFWKGGNYDLLVEGKEGFVKKPAKIRAHANKLGTLLAHEIHPGTAAMCEDDFNKLVAACNGDPCLAVNAGPSHCWEGESWETRFLKVAPRVYACHVKNYVIRPGLPLRMMEGGWQKRAMQFVDIPSGDLNMTRYVEMLIHIGYPRRYCAAAKAKTAPLIVETESTYGDLDKTSANGIAYVRDNLCFPIKARSVDRSGFSRRPITTGICGQRKAANCARWRTSARSKLQWAPIRKRRHLFL